MRKSDAMHSVSLEPVIRYAHRCLLSIFRWTSTVRYVWCLLFWAPLFSPPHLSLCAESTHYLRIQILSPFSYINILCHAFLLYPEKILPGTNKKTCRYYRNTVNVIKSDKNHPDNNLCYVQGDYRKQASYPNCCRFAPSFRYVFTVQISFCFLEV